MGYVPDISSADAVQAALDLAGAGDLVRSLPEGVRTRLDGDGSDRSGCEGFCGDGFSSKLHGLSGGEVSVSALAHFRAPTVQVTAR